MITYQDYEKAENKTQWLQYAITSYMDSAEYKKAKEEEEYMAGRNTAIMNAMRVIYNMAGIPEQDFTASNIKIRDNTIHRLVTDRCSYSLGNGISFPGRRREVRNGKSVYVDDVKAMLGPKIDRQLKKAAYWAQANGESYLYVYMGKNDGKWHYTLFRKTGFLALYDEKTGDLRGGVRFWSLDWGYRPITAILYTETGYTKYRTKEGEYSVSSLIQDGNEKPYIEKVASSEAFGEEIVGSDQLSRLPIFPLYSGENRGSALDKLKALIDSTDMVLSGFANDLHDVAQVYWLISGANGMTEDDKREFLDRIILQHVAAVDGENAKVDAKTIEIPYEARERCIAQLRNKMYENYGGFDIHMVEAGATNDHIDAAYWPMDEEADDFEYEIIDTVQAILGMMGVDEADSVPIFKRNRVSNQKEQTEMVVSAAQYLDDRTIVEKLPFITVDEVDDILERKDGENFGRFTQTDENDEDNEGGEV